MQEGLYDKFQRRVRKMRISVTDRCNFRCRYCLPAGDIDWLPRADLLSFEEIERIASIVAGMGVEKLRLTGGEPLARRDLERLVEKLVRIPGIKKVSMTTNGYFLPKKARLLRAAGLEGVNVSLDTLDRERFKEMTRRDYFDRVIDGIAAAEVAGLNVKTNAVVMRGQNDDEIADFLRWGRSKGITVRFIEFMPIDGSNIWNRDLVVPVDEILERAAAVAPVVPLNNNPSDPARLYTFEDGVGEFGIIASVSAPFCRNCDRIRLTADGKIRNCLFALNETDLLAPLRRGADDAELAALIRRDVWHKWEGHLINQANFVKPRRTMHAIGG